MHKLGIVRTEANESD